MKPNCKVTFRYSTIGLHPSQLLFPIHGDFKFKEIFICSQVTWLWPLTETFVCTNQEDQSIVVDLFGTIYSMPTRPPLPSPLHRVPYLRDVTTFVTRATSFQDRLGLFQQLIWMVLPGWGCFSDDSWTSCWAAPAWENCSIIILNILSSTNWFFFLCS